MTYTSSLVYKTNWMYQQGLTCLLYTSHAVCFVEDPDTAPVTTDGPVMEHHADFPERINVEFVKVENRGHLRIDVYKRQG